MAQVKQVDVIILGTGSAALSAASEVRQVTDNFIIASNGVYGTTCIRAGCMPSNVLVQGAELYHQRRLMEDYGMTGAETLPLDSAVLLDKVRAMREHFLKYVLKYTHTFDDWIVEGDVRFHAPNEIAINGVHYRARHVVLATGSTPIIPVECQGISQERIITSDTLFELERLPESIGVVGLSVLGAEMALALARLGIRVTALHDSDLIGGLSDPVVSEYALNRLRGEMDIHIKDCVSFEEKGGRVRITCSSPVEVDALFVAMSREANLDHLGLAELGVIAPDMPVIDFDPETMQIRGFPIFVAGDVKLGRSILNEAVDEGRIAGYNAARETPVRFRRRTRLQISHTEPAIAVIGMPYEEVNRESAAIGEYTYDDQGRAKIMGEAAGMLRVYTDEKSGVLLGAEIFAPRGEHLAHELAWIIDRKLTVFDALQLPFYHPSLEEGLLGVFKDLAEKIPATRPAMALCL